MSGQQFANAKYRNWVKAALGFKHVREGLESFCDDIVNQEHADIVNKVKQKHNLTTSSCGQCNLRTLQPDHVRTKYKQCPLGQKDCNCQYPGGKVACSNNLCGAIYDEIINLHASIPPSPYWKNTDVKLWCSQPWAIAKCFINASGYSQKSTASEIDCSGLLHVLINNKGLQKHIHCKITATDVFSKVRQHRNTTFHSENMEIEDADVITYIDDMIDVLQDSKELYNRNESKSAVQKLLQLKQHDFIITSSMEAEVRAARTSLIELKDKLGREFKAEVEQIELNVQADIEQKALDAKAEVDQKSSDVKTEVDQKGSDVKAEIAQKASDVKTEVDKKGSDVKAEVDQKGSDVKAEIAQKASDVKAELELKGSGVMVEVNKKGSDIKAEVDMKGSDVKAEIDQKGLDVKADIDKKGLDVKAEIAQKASDVNTEVDKKGSDVKADIAQKASDVKAELELKGSGVMVEVNKKGSDFRAEVDKKCSDVKEEVDQKGSDVKAEIAQKALDVKTEVDKKGSDVKAEVDQKGSDVKAEIAKKVLDVKAELELKGSGVMMEVNKKISDVKAEVDKKGSDVKSEVDQKGLDVKAEIDQKGLDVRAGVDQKCLDISTEVDQKGFDVRLEVDQKGLDVKADIAQKASDVKAELDLKGWHIQADLEQKGKRLQEQMYRTPPSEQSRLVHTQDEYIIWKAGFRKKLVRGYMKYAIKASALPLQPERYQREVWDVYVPQWMTVEIESNEESGKTREISISMHELFRNEENPAQNIFVLGEAGSGKSTFCKIIIYYWCLAHSGHVPTNGEANIIKELNEYEFLFYVALRHYPDCNSIEMMLKEIHQDPSLITLLHKESDKCLILLDGLDEWTPQRQCSSQFQTSGLPARDLFADYTTVTTSRDWKFDTLRISDSEVDKKVKLKGISGTAIIDLSEKTVETLNKIFHKNKVADDFKTDLKKSPIADVKHVPMILQQLVCLWFDDNLNGTSRCAVYSSMLDLFFDWKSLKKPLNDEDVLPPISRSDLQLPDFFKDYEACVENNYSIYHLSYLAFETLFDKHQESCLTFTNSTFQALNIPDNVIACGLKVGILSEDQSACLFASRRKPSSFSFVHKSLQEYLAAVYVAIQYETKSQSSCVVAKSDIGKHTEDLYQFLSKYFASCTSVTYILKQSNVFIMLSGLEPQLLPYISEYIYHIAMSDNQMIQGRKLTHENFIDRTYRRLQESIQDCIESCMKEVLSREIEFENSVYIADVVFQVGIEKSFIERQLIRLNSVLSLNVTRYHNCEGQYMQQLYSVLNHLSKCDSLQSIKYDSGHKSLACSVKIEENLIDLIDKNSQTLTTVCLNCINLQIMQSLIQNLSRLHHLTSLRIKHIGGITIPHEYCESLCEFLEQSIQLQQIYLFVRCSMRDKHLIDLTKLKQLLNLDVRFGSVSVTRFSSDNIENCTLGTNTIDTFKQVLDSLCNACNLKVLSLWNNYMSSVGTTVTDNLNRLLPSLISLNTLELYRFVITDNIIARPSDMKHLKLIKLWEITMCLPAWRKLIDILPALPQAVRVPVGFLYIVDSSIIEKADYMYSLSKHDTNGKTATRQYVREKTELFQVTNENEDEFMFVTKKANI